MDGVIGIDGASAFEPWTAPVTDVEAAPAPPEPLDALDDAALVRACVQGHHGAFDCLVTRHQRNVYQLCYRFAGNHEDASDLVQDVFVRAYRALDRFQGGASFTTWLYRITVNACLSRASRKKPATEPLDERILEPAAQDTDAVARLLADERAARVRAAIAKLPPKQRATLLLRVYQELRHDEIAAVLGSSVGAVKANFFHALRGLRRLLGGEPL